MKEHFKNYEIKFCKRSCYFSRKKNFFISYPKSGRTWARFLVDAYKAELYGLRIKNVFKAERRLRLKHHVEWTHLSAADMADPYYAMVPENLDLLERTPSVFMIRNFHATLASAWFQVTARLGFDVGDTDSFLRGVNYGAMHIIPFFNSWIEIEKRLPPVKYVSYSRLKSDTKEEFIHILKSLDLPVDDAIVDRTLEMGSFDNMKRLATSAGYEGTPLAPTDRSNPNSAKVRSATSGGFRKVFTEEQIGYINETIERHFVGLDDPRFAECIEEMS